MHMLRFRFSTPRRVETLVVSGGGMKGVASLGAVVALRKCGMLKNVKTVVGTSAGALVAAAFATDRASLATLDGLAARKYQADIDISGLLASFGIDSGRDLERWIEVLLGRNYTFRELFESTGVNLVVCATNLTERKPEYFSVDTAPDMDLALALRMSCTIPLYFAAVRQDGKVYVDGAVSDNFPLVWASDKYGANTTLGITFRPRASDPGNSLEEFLGAMVECTTRRHYVLEDKRVLALDTGARSAFEFNMSKRDMKRLYMAGFRQAKAWMKKNV